VQLSAWLQHVLVSGRGMSRDPRRISGPGPVLVLGTGRSGTHWIGHILESHPDIAITIEREPMFSLAKSMALDPASVSRRLPELVRHYRRYRAAFHPRLYADKSHPTIWFAERLQAHLPDVRFVGVLRDAAPTVASMLRHRGVMRTIRAWRDHPVPNPFLGITEANVEAYAGMSEVERCAVRWRAHARRLDELEGPLGDRLLRFSYETLADDPATELARLQRFLALERPFPHTPVRRESLDKWRRDLTDEQLDAIRRVTEP
jgi:hypothetical protein